MELTQGEKDQGRLRGNRFATLSHFIVFPGLFSSLC